MKKLTKDLLKQLILEEIESLREWPDPENPLRGGGAAPLYEEESEEDEEEED